MRSAIVAAVLMACGSNDATDCVPFAEPHDTFDGPGLACGTWGRTLPGAIAYRADGALVIDQGGEFMVGCIDGYDMTQGIQLQLRDFVIGGPDGWVQLAVTLDHTPDTLGHVQAVITARGDGTIEAGDDFDPNQGRRPYRLTEASWWRMDNGIDSEGRAAIVEQVSGDGRTWSMLGTMPLAPGDTLGHAQVSINEALLDSQVRLESVNCTAN